MMDTYYFGCWGDVGHYLWHCGRGGQPYKEWRTDDELLGKSRHSSGGGTPGRIPWGYALDGGLLNGRNLKQGEAVVARRDGWTAVSFWDRSVDTRGGSSSTFVFDAELDDEEALRLARELWPPVFARYTFEVVLAS